MRIAICGTRGVPACYGGFETFAEQLGARLVERGHEVTVYGRTHVIDYSQPTYKGMKIRLLPAPKHKYLETPVHTFRSFVDIKRGDMDVILLCNAANSPVAWLPRLRRIPVVINVDGIERRRAKWNALGRLWYRLGEVCSVWFGSRIISDADMIADYYLEHYGITSSVIRYGAIPVDDQSLVSKLSENAGFSVPTAVNKTLSELNLQAGRYLLYVSRLEPENNALRVVQAYAMLPESIRKQFPLVVVGDAPYAREYIAAVKAAAPAEVRFLGYRFGETYQHLSLGAYLYVQATEVGGTHPALVESMGFANLVIANDTPEHREVLLDCGVYYSKNSVDDLARCLAEATDNSCAVTTFRRAALTHCRNDYNWDKITSEYESLFASCVLS